MTTKLINKPCVPCQGGVPSLTADEIRSLMKQLDDGWTVIEDHHLEKTYTFPDFKSALAFVNRVGELAEHEGHHPDIELGWGRVVLKIWTHKIDGLTESDFILAAKADTVQ